MFADYLLQHQGPLYTVCYFFGFSLVALSEAFVPRRKLTQPMGLRWVSNISINLLGFCLTRLFLPMTAVAVAFYASSQQIGLFNHFNVPASIAVLTTFVLLDLRTYAQHILQHRVPILWRLHAVHHSDPDYDFSTGLRFHPLEAIFTLAVESLLILILGAPAIAVMLFNLVAMLMAAFGHGNLKLHSKVDYQLRKILVTPDLHRIHHSVIPHEANSNYGGITPWWDRLFGTYIDQPQLGHEKLEVGLRGMQTVEWVKLHRMILQPFTRSQLWQSPVTSPTPTKSVT